MKLMYLFYFALCVHCFFLSAGTLPDTTIKHTEKQLTNQSDILELFFVQPQYSRSSFRFFLKNIYNHSKYAQSFLSLNFSHITTFLSYSKESEVPRDYINRVIGLFGQKLKSSIYINGYAFSELLERLPESLKPYVIAQEEQKAHIESIKSCIYSYLLSDFKTLKENPEHALDELSYKIYELSQDTNTGDISIAKLQQSVTQFLEIALNKLIWCPKDQQEVWESVKSIARHLEQLLVTNVIPNTEVLDELYWSLIQRFCHFLDLAGVELTQSCYQVINDDLITQKSSLWLLKEREEYITTKFDYLKNALLQAEVKARAYQEGIIADTINPRI